MRSLLLVGLLMAAPVASPAQTPNASVSTAAAPAIVVDADRVMASPRPTAPLSEWVEAPGRERVTLDVPGATLRGWRYAGGAPDGPVLILFGGNGFLIKNYDELARQLAPHTSAVLAYDFRGYGFSTGKARALTLREDGLLIFDAAAGQAGSPKKVVVWGNSMGSTIAAYIAARRPDAGGMVLVGAPSSAADALSLRPGRTAAPDLADFLGVADQLARTSVPLLLIHGSLDTQSLPAHAQKNLEASAASDKELVMLQGVDHPSSSRHPDSVAAVRSFLAARR